MPIVAEVAAASAGSHLAPGLSQRPALQAGVPIYL